MARIVVVPRRGRNTSNSTPHGDIIGYCQVKQFGGILAARRHR